MAADPVVQGSFLSKIYFVLVHFILFLLGFYIIQSKAKSIEHEREQKDEQKKAYKKEKDILTSLNSYLKISYSHTGSLVQRYVNKWITSIERKLKKELKELTVKQGFEKIVSCIEIQRNNEIPCKIDALKLHWQKDGEMILDLIIQTKTLKFKVVDMKKDTSYFVLPSMNLKGLVHISCDSITSIHKIEVKALREIKLSLSVEGKYKDMCKCIAESLNNVLMKPTNITIQNEIDLQNEKTVKTKDLQSEDSESEDSQTKEPQSEEKLKSAPGDDDKDQIAEKSTDDIETEHEASPQQEAQQKDDQDISPPSYDNLVNDGRIRSASNTSVNQFVNDTNSNSSSFEPITPLSPSSISVTGPDFMSHNGSTSYDSDSNLFGISPKDNNESFTTVDSFQALHGTFDQAFVENNMTFPNFAPAVPKRTRRSSGSKNSDTPKSGHTPIIQNAIEPQFTTTEVPHTIKTPILRTKDDGSLRQRKSQLTKSNLMRHSFHHGTRPDMVATEQSMSTSSNESESPASFRSTVSQSSLTTAIGYVQNKSSALLIEVQHGLNLSYYHIPPAMVKRGNYPIKGKKLHVYNEHIFSATHFTGSMPSCCVCSLPLRRLGKQGYSCRDCKIIVHKRCHCKVVETCPLSSLTRMEIEYVGGTDV